MASESELRSPQLAHGGTTLRTLPSRPFKTLFCLLQALQPRYLMGRRDFFHLSQKTKGTAKSE